MIPSDSSQNLALRVVQQLQAKGFIAYFAGGCVRDRLMHRTPKDFDVATSATPQQVLALFPRSQQVGAAFGVILVREKIAGTLHHIEVATFRADGLYSDGRHPDSIRFTNAQEDAQRRDFTCNGLFLDPITDTLHDFVGGQKDIAAKTLRAIGNPLDRFNEDHLRMLRAIRFAARLQFSIAPETAEAIRTLQKKIDAISRERIGEELRMILQHPNRLPAIKLLSRFPDMFTAIFGFPPPIAAEDHDWPILSGLPAAAHRPLALAALLQDANNTPNTPQLRERLVLSNQETDELLFFTQKIPLLQKWEDLPKSILKRLIADPRWKDLDTLYRADPENADQLLAYAERIATLTEEGAAPTPFITGADLIALGAIPSPQFRRWLDYLYDRQLEGDLKTLDEARAAAISLLQK